ncbi:DUF5605 domain-containing protein [Kineococcus sp. SYSU DK006]|uniref:DUF5605 domain-containing protein n=1 Tax=Kineococcus sp. SYSU DK006 TaxID=3383127 RepID=UPI003D7C846C
MSRTRTTAPFDRDTPLLEVLRSAAGDEVLRRLAPSVVESPLLHTYQNHPVGLVLDTEEGLDPQVRERVLSELAMLTEPAAGAAPGGGAPAERPVVPAPTRDYEGPAVAPGSAGVSAPDGVEVWERFEVRLQGPSHGNPFTDVELTARFFGPDGGGHDVLGFYDGAHGGAGRYVVRFLPPAPGRWRYETTSNARSLDGVRGELEVRPGAGRGPVRVAERHHFRYADGSRYLPVGTTCYAWTHQEEELQELTLRTLAASPFTKVRMCLFPKSYTFNTGEPSRYPFARRGGGGWDPTRFDPAYWAHLEQRIDQLAALGVEADLILFHAYDRWGFATMDSATDDRYVRYAVARLSAFRNVWWSLANEFDLLHTKTEADWERWAATISRWDATGHLRSIHNCHEVYDHSRPWITHVSMQRTDVYRTAENTTEWRAAWGKPVLVDECAYEGDIDQGWGSITGEEMTRRCWEGALRGGYVGHGETYLDPDEVLWWSKGGALRGSSPERIAFLASIVREAPGGVLDPLPGAWDAVSAGVAGEHHLVYFGLHRPGFRRFFLDPATAWEVDVVDTWNMTVETLPGTRSGRFVVDLPGRPYIAVRLRAHHGATVR